MKRDCLIALSCAAALMAGCASDRTGQKDSFKTGALKFASSMVREAGGGPIAFLETGSDAKLTSARIRALLEKKQLDSDTAMKIALLNNRGLQVALADVGIASAELWQQSLPPNPHFSLGLMGIAAPQLGAFRALEGLVATNMLSMLTRKQRVEIARNGLHGSLLSAVAKAFEIMNMTRKAWINAVAAREIRHQLAEAVTAADAAAEFTLRLGETGASGKSLQARKQAIYAELAAQNAKAELQAELSELELGRVMGLWEGTAIRLPDRLPELPAKAEPRRMIVGEALTRRIDLMIARTALAATAKHYGLAHATRFVSDFELVGGLEYEREIDAELEIEDGNPEKKKLTESSVLPNLEVEFTLPLFDTGEARLRKAELAYLKMAHELARRSVDVRAQARSAHTAYLSRYDIARHYRDAVMPLQSIIEEQSLLTYNGMITSAIDLLDATTGKIATAIRAIEAKKNFWLAEADLWAAVYGGFSGEADVSVGSVSGSGDGAGH